MCQIINITKINLFYEIKKNNINLGIIKKIDYCNLWVFYPSHDILYFNSIELNVIFDKLNELNSNLN